MTDTDRLQLPDTKTPRARPHGGGPSSHQALIGEPALPCSALGGPVDFVIRGCRQVLTMPPEKGPVRDRPGDAGCLEFGGAGGVTIAGRGGRIVWIGPTGGGEEAAAIGEMSPGATQIDGTGLVVLPGLVDCHTHLIFGGDRSREYHQRNRGVSYQEIAARGGGIQATVDATLRASGEELFHQATERLHRSMGFGVTTIEIKSGYGLSTEGEVKILEVARRLGEEHPVTVIPTFLGAHAIPAQYGGQGRRQEYVDKVINRMLPAVAARKLARYCDVFVEEGAGAFTVDEARQIFARAAQLGMTARLHADQFTDGGGARLAAEVKAASADHLESLSPHREDLIRELREGEVTAVLLPGVTVFMGLDTWPPARSLLQGGVRVALATDCNPGSCHSENLLLMTTLACSYLKMTPEEALAGITVEPARSMGLLQDPDGGVRGTLTRGAWCDLACYRVSDYTHIPYRFGTLEAALVIKEGGVVVRDGRPWERRRGWSHPQ